MIDFDDRTFASVANSESGDVGSGTTFHYHQKDDIVWATYHGLLVADHTPVAVADALRRVITNRAGRETMALAARRSAARFTLPVIAGRYDAVMREVLA